MNVEPAKQKRDAQFARCETCDQWLGSQYWSIQKSAALHKHGTGHKVDLYQIVKEGS